MRIPQSRCGRWPIQDSHSPSRSRRPRRCGEVPLNQALLSSCATTKNGRPDRSRASSGERRRCGARCCGHGYLRALGCASTLRAWCDQPGFFSRPNCFAYSALNRCQPSNFMSSGPSHASDRFACEEPIEDVEADVPARGAPRDEAAIDVVPERKARAAAERFELPADVAASQSVLEQPRRLGPLHGGLGDLCGVPTVESFTGPTAARFLSASNGAHSRRCAGSVSACQTFAGG